MSERDGRATAALVMSAVALLLSVYGVATRGKSSPVARGASDASPSTVDTEARDAIDRLSRQNAALRDQQVASLEARVAKLEGSGAASPPSAVASSVHPQKDAPKRYAKLSIAASGVTVDEGENGAIRVVNHDPSLTGKTLTVNATRTDGTAETLHVVVPPP